MGLTAVQHQLLLAIRGHDDPRGPAIGEVADYLLLRHHSVVGLVDRAELAGLVVRATDPEDGRVVRLSLTQEGAERLEKLTTVHVEELKRLASQIAGISDGLGPINETHGFQRVATTPPSPRVTVARVYDDRLPVDRGRRVLVDRLWPRALKRDGAPLDEWFPEAAPSAELRKWYGHRPERFDEFARRYRAELRRKRGRLAVEHLTSVRDSDGLVLVTATRDLERSGAMILAQVLGATEKER